MNDLEIALWSFPVLMVCIFIRIPIGASMLAIGLVGTWLVAGSWTPILGQLKNSTWGNFSNYSLSIIPLFLLMGQFAAHGGMSKALFKAAEAFLGHRKGGVAMAAVGACAGFGAICGSSLATAGTMAQVALPELKRNGYSGGLATAALAAGGTLGILIPPSVVLVIYAILTEQNIAKLFVAACIPGILAAIFYMLTIAIVVRISSKDKSIESERIPWLYRLRYVVDIWPVLIIFFLVVGGIYLGWFTPTEAAAIGAAGTGIVAWLKKGLNRVIFSDCLKKTAISTGMIFFIVLGAAVYNTFLAFSQLPQSGAEWVVEQGFSPWFVLLIILVLYIILGCIMDSMSMILLTVPILFPIVSVMEFGLSPEEFALWFGVLILVVAEIGLITPPVGLNLFIINSMAKDVPINESYKGILPFISADLIRTVLLVLFPSISLWMIHVLY